MNDLGYFDVYEADLPPIGFGEIIRNPMALIFYIFCFWILLSFGIFFIKYINENL